MAIQNLYEILRPRNHRVSPLDTPRIFGWVNNSNLFLITDQFSTAVHAVLTLRGRLLIARVAGDVAMKFEHSLLFNHHPSDPSIGYSQQYKQANDRTGAQRQELNTQCKSEEHTGGKYVDWPFQAHN